jgi:hypothetical protein
MGGRDDITGGRGICNGRVQCRPRGTVVSLGAHTNVLLRSGGISALLAPAPAGEEEPSMRVLMSHRRRAVHQEEGPRIHVRVRRHKAVSISDGSDKSPTATPQTAASTTPLTGTSVTTTTTTKSTRGGGGGYRPAVAASTTEAPSLFSSTSFYADTTDDGPSSMESTPSLSALMRQLCELERSVRFLHSARAGAKEEADAGKLQSGGSRQRRTVSEGGSGRVEESVVVVKESANPLGDFRDFGRGEAAWRRGRTTAVHAYDTNISSSRDIELVSLYLFYSRII